MSKSHPTLTSDVWKELRAVLNAKIAAARPYTQMDEKSRLYAQLSASWITSAPWDEDEETLRAAKLTALAAIAEHTPAHCKTLHAMRVIAQGENSVTFEAPSLSRPGYFYRPVLSKRDLTVECGCEGSSRTGHCWHQDSARSLYALLEPLAAIQRPQSLVTIENMLDASFDALDTLDDVMVGYESENAKPQRMPDFSADAIARSKAPVTAKDAAYFDALLTD